MIFISALCLSLLHSYAASQCTDPVKCVEKVALDTGFKLVKKSIGSSDPLINVYIKHDEKLDQNALEFSDLMQDLNDKSKPARLTTTTKRPTQIKKGQTINRVKSNGFEFLDLLLLKGTEKPISALKREQEKTKAKIHAQTQPTYVLTTLRTVSTPKIPVFSDPDDEETEEYWWPAQGNKSKAQKPAEITTTTSSTTTTVVTDVNGVKVDKSDETFGLTDIKRALKDSIESIVVDYKKKRIPPHLGHNIDVESIVNQTVKLLNHTQDKHDEVKMPVENSKTTTSNNTKPSKRTKQPNYNLFKDYALGLDYDGRKDNETDYSNIDYINLFKGVTNPDVEYTTVTLTSTSKRHETTKANSIVQIFNYSNLDRHAAVKINDTIQNNLFNNTCIQNASATSASEVVFPWIATIFIKDSPTNRFKYSCDGALLTQRTIVTAANCMFNGTNLTETENLLVILGKRDQNNMTSNAIYRIKKVVIHPQYSKLNDIDNDLALLITQDPVQMVPNLIQTACIYDSTTKQDEIVEGISTGWVVAGNLIPIFFDVQTSNRDCLGNIEKNTTTDFCASYSSDVVTCPSFGGLYVVRVKNGFWYLKGISSELMTPSRYCVKRNLRFTDITKHDEWLKTTVI